MTAVKHEACPDPGLAEALVMLAVKLPRTLRALDARAVLSATEASALAVLVHGGTMTLAELAKHEQVKPPSMTRTVAQLESKGYVARQPCERDGRAWRIRATAQGVSVFRAGHRRRLRPLDAWLAALDPGSRAALIGIVPILQAMATLGPPPVRSTPPT